MRTCRCAVRGSVPVGGVDIEPLAAVLAKGAWRPGEQVARRWLPPSIPCLLRLKPQATHGIRERLFDCGRKPRSRAGGRQRPLRIANRRGRGYQEMVSGAGTRDWYQENGIRVQGEDGIASRRDCDVHAEILRERDPAAVGLRAAGAEHIIRARMDVARPVSRSSVVLTVGDGEVRRPGGLTVSRGRVWVST